MGEQDTARRGRPRDMSRDEAIRRAVLELLAEEGYQALTVDAVAARARAGKATIYRRWSGKAELVVDSIASVAGHALPRPDTGHVREDLIEFFTGWVSLLDTPIGRAGNAVLSELPRNPELATAFRTVLWQPIKDLATSLLRRAVERGEVPADAPLEIVGELAGASIFYRQAVTGDPLDETFVRSVVDRALMPLLLCRPPVGEPMG